MLAPSTQTARSEVAWVRSDPDDVIREELDLDHPFITERVDARRGCDGNAVLEIENGWRQAQIRWGRHGWVSKRRPAQAPQKWNPGQDATSVRQFGRVGAVGTVIEGATEQRFLVVCCIASSPSASDGCPHGCLGAVEVTGNATCDGCGCLGGEEEAARSSEPFRSIGHLPSPAVRQETRPATRVDSGPGSGGEEHRRSPAGLGGRRLQHRPSARPPPGSAHSPAIDPRLDRRRDLHPAIEVRLGACDRRCFREPLIEPGQGRERAVAISVDQEPFRFTLGWTDRVADRASAPDGEGHALPAGSRRRPEERRTTTRAFEANSDAILAPDPREGTATSCLGSARPGRAVVDLDPPMTRDRQSMQDFIESIDAPICQSIGTPLLKIVAEHRAPLWSDDRDAIAAKRTNEHVSQRTTTPRPTQSVGAPTLVIRV